MVKKVVLVFFGLFAGLLQAQSVWQDVADKDISPLGERRIVPQQYRSVQLNYPSLHSLFEAASAGQAPVLTLPAPGGGTIRFRLVPATVLAPALQAKYPGIRCFKGYGVDQTGATLSCDWTPWGFHAMIHQPGREDIFIDPYSQGDTENYVVYHKNDYLPKAKKQTFSCTTNPGSAFDSHEILPGQPVSSRGNDGQKRQYRLALACTGEYAAFHGGEKPLVLAAMVTSINRINMVYEREFAITLQLIGNTDTLIFLDGATDPYDNEDGGTMLGQNRSTCNDLIGSANYDMGHVFSTGGGGIASIRSVCTNNKAQGVTGQEEPIGDAFDIDYVAHEMGHQFGGNHTQNNDCNRNGSTAMEPGSASSIMGYAGICSPDVQQHSDDYFHGINVEEIVSFIVDGNGNNCPLLIPTNNNAPEVSAGLDYIIPKSTPFVLSAQGTDPDGDANKLSYCWEQMDPESADMPPLSSSVDGPLFRSYSPDSISQRYFPRLINILTNTIAQWEKLPAVGRKMNFRVTLRDNHPAGGRTAQDDMLVTVDNNSGPFRITSPNTLALAWHPDEYQIVSWDVANTSAAPVNCSAVNLWLSLDGGYTYPVLLAEQVPNTGNYCVRVPDVATTKARIKVEAVGNIFFDVSNFNFRIEPAAAPGFSMCPASLSARVCLPASYSTLISTSSVQGFGQAVELSATGLPPGVLAVFTPNPVMPGDDTQLSLLFPDGTPEGSLDLGIVGVADTDSVAITVKLTLVSNDFAGLVLNSPAKGASGLDQSPILRWQKITDALSYEVQVASSPTFDAAALVSTKQNIVVDSFKIPILLDKGLVYYWRVRPANECGPGDWVGPYAFATLYNVCQIKESAEIPVNITSNAAVTVESRILVNGNSTVSDINIKKIQGNHSFFKDLEMHLISPSGTDVQLFKSKCGGFSGNFTFGFDDSRPNGLVCPPNNNGTVFKPDSALSKMNGEDAMGFWTLRVKDNAISSGGAILAFDLEICANAQLDPPVLINNNPLTLEPGTNKGISVDLLKTIDANNSDEQLVYTLMTEPEHGQLQVFGNGALKPGSTFTQAELNNGGLRYFDYGHSAPEDQFCFTVTDGEGGLVQDCFTIQPFPLDAREPDAALDFLLAPNPSTGFVRLAFEQAYTSDTRIRVLDAAGRLLRSQVLASGQLSTQIDLSGLPEGLYAVGVDNAAGIGVRKIMVKQ
ncbi:MAG: proprotein convertase P-domain-containing protein [Saprospiraceae bacterium]|nr:proprotein convertase P-domain-containing protein [Saprospiraceae bacterium]